MSPEELDAACNEWNQLKQEIKPLKKSIDAGELSGNEYKEAIVWVYEAQKRSSEMCKRQLDMTHNDELMDEVRARRQWILVWGRLGWRACGGWWVDIGHD